MPFALGRAKAKGRTSVVHHSNHGEFAYRDGSWKLVFKMSGRNLQQSRGKPTITASATMVTVPPSLRTRAMGKAYSVTVPACAKN